MSFVSGLFNVTGDMPDWQEKVASVLPLTSFNDAVQHQFDPAASGAGWDLPALLMLGASGLAGGLVATWRYGWEPLREHGSARQARAAVPGLRTASVVRSAARRPSVAGVLLDQVRWAVRTTLRDLSAVVFAIGMPVGLFAFAMTSSDDAATAPHGAPFAPYVAGGMIAWGVAVNGFINLPGVVAQARERGVLARLRGTPLTPALYLAGRVGSAAWLGLVTAALVVGVGVAFFGLRLTLVGSMAIIALVLVGTVTLAAGGLALSAALPTAKAVTAVGLGVLLPLAFISDVFGFGAVLPAWMSTAASLMPLKHLANLLTVALDAGAPVGTTPFLVVGAWLVLGAVVALRTFRWRADD
jgi:ABC-type multidrug transport system permease subunit